MVDFGETQNNKSRTRGTFVRFCHNRYCHRPDDVCLHHHRHHHRPSSSSSTSTQIRTKSKICTYLLMCLGPEKLLNSSQMKIQRALTWRRRPRRPRRWQRTKLIYQPINYNDLNESTARTHYTCAVRRSAVGICVAYPSIVVPCILLF